MMESALIGGAVGLVCAFFRILYLRKHPKKPKHGLWWHFWHDDNTSFGGSSYGQIF